jgi:hypothetical protein
MILNQSSWNYYWHFVNVDEERNFCTFGSKPYLIVPAKAEELLSKIV